MRIQALVFGFNLWRGSVFDSPPCSFRQNLRYGLAQAKRTVARFVCCFVILQTQPGTATSVTNCQLLKIFSGSWRRTLEFQSFRCHTRLFGKRSPGKGKAISLQAWLDRPRGFQDLEACIFVTYCAVCS